MGLFSVRQATLNLTITKALAIRRLRSSATSIQILRIQLRCLSHVSRSWATVTQTQKTLRSCLKQDKMRPSWRRPRNISLEMISLWFFPRSKKQKISKWSNSMILMKNKKMKKMALFMMTLAQAHSSKPLSLPNKSHQAQPISRISISSMRKASLSTSKIIRLKSQSKN